MRVPDLTIEDSGALALESFKPDRNEGSETYYADMVLIAELAGEGQIELPALFGTSGVEALSQASDPDHGTSTLIQRDPLVEVRLALSLPDGGRRLLSGVSRIKRAVLHAVADRPRVVYLVRSDITPDEVPDLLRAKGRVLTVTSTGTNQPTLPLGKRAAADGAKVDGEGNVVNDADLPPEPTGKPSRKRKPAADQPTAG